MKTNYNILNSLTGIALLLAFGQASAITCDTTLSNWNEPSLDASGDYVCVVTGTDTTYSWFSVQWVAGADNELDAIGIQTVFYNCDGCSLSNQKDDDTGTFGGVFEVYTGATAGALTNDVTSEWDANFGGTEGDGFGNFTSRKTHDGGTTEGITNWITFLLIDETLLPFIANDHGATMTAHVRYENNCSGWASDGTTTSQETNGNCGDVPEPTPLVLLAMGLGVIGLGRRLAILRKS